MIGPTSFVVPLAAFSLLTKSTRSLYISSALACCVATVSETHLVGVVEPQLSPSPSRDGGLTSLLGVVRFATGDGDTARFLTGDLVGVFLGGMAQWRFDF